MLRMNRILAIRNAQSQATESTDPETGETNQNDVTSTSETQTPTSTNPTPDNQNTDDIDDQPDAVSSDFEILTEECFCRRLFVVVTDKSESYYNFHSAMTDSIRSDEVKVVCFNTKLSTADTIASDLGVCLTLHLDGYDSGYFQNVVLVVMLSSTYYEPCGKDKLRFTGFLGSFYTTSIRTLATSLYKYTTKRVLTDKEFRIPMLDMLVISNYGNTAPHAHANVSICPYTHFTSLGPSASHWSSWCMRVPYAFRYNSIPSYTQFLSHCDSIKSTDVISIVNIPPFTSSREVMGLDLDCFVSNERGIGSNHHVREFFRMFPEAISYSFNSRSHSHSCYSACLIDSANLQFDFNGFAHPGKITKHNTVGVTLYLQPMLLRVDAQLEE